MGKPELNSSLEGKTIKKKDSLVSNGKKEILESLNQEIDVRRDTEKKVDRIFNYYWGSEQWQSWMDDRYLENHYMHDSDSKRKLKIRTANAKLMDDKDKEELIMDLWSEFHEKWRKSRKKMKDWTYEPRMKKTKDVNRIRQNWTDEIDIANTEFKDLPTDWQKENYQAAKYIINLVYDRTISVYTVHNGYYGKLFSFDAIEKLASKVHDNWMKRNEWQKDSNPELFVLYSELPETEKAKDRVQIIGALKKVVTKIKKW